MGKLPIPLSNNLGEGEGWETNSFFFLSSQEMPIFMTLLVLKALSEIKTNLKGCESKPMVRLLRECRAGRNEPFSSGEAAAQQV